MTKPSPCEIHALQLVARGYSINETASVLRKSPETVKSQLGTARLKLGAANTVHAAVIALDRGLIAA